MRAEARHCRRSLFKRNLLNLFLPFRSQESILNLKAKKKKAKELLMQSNYEWTENDFCDFFEHLFYKDTSRKCLLLRLYCPDILRTPFGDVDFSTTAGLSIGDGLLTEFIAKVRNGEIKWCKFIDRHQDQVDKAYVKSHDEIRERMLRSTKSNCFRASVGESILDLTEDDFLDFDTIGELEQHHKIVQTKFYERDFYRLSRSSPKGFAADDEIGSWTLMAEYDSGKKWFVVGWLARGDKQTDLPIFKLE